MATINGPKVQIPNTGQLDPGWASFHHSVQQVAFNSTRSGPAASRPTDQLLARWIGMPYFNTDIQQTEFLASIRPDVWITWTNGSSVTPSTSASSSTRSAPGAT